METVKEGNGSSCFQLADWKDLDKIHVKVQTAIIKKEPLSLSLIAAKCGCILGDSRQLLWMQQRLSSSFASLPSIGNFFITCRKANLWSAFHKRRPVKTDHNCTSNIVYLIWFPCSLHCLLSFTFSFPSGRLGRQLASQQTPAPQLGSWQAAIAFLFVETVCLAGPHGTLAHYNPFALGTWLHLLALDQEYKGFNWLLNSNNFV